MNVHFICADLLLKSDIIDIGMIGYVGTNDLDLNMKHKVSFRHSVSHKCNTGPVRDQCFSTAL